VSSLNSSKNISTFIKSLRRSFKSFYSS
jgi:hypothetical protein